MKSTIQFLVKKGQDGYYTAHAKGLVIAVPKARTSDKVVQNISMATNRYFADAIKKTPKNRRHPIEIQYEIPA